MAAATGCAPQPPPAVAHTVPPPALPACAVPNYWENRWGTRGAPIIIEAAEGRGSVTLGNMNLFDVRQAAAHLLAGSCPVEAQAAHAAVRCISLSCRPARPLQPHRRHAIALALHRCRHLYLINLVLRSENDVFHCERCLNLLLRNVTGWRERRAPGRVAAYARKVRYSLHARELTARRRAYHCMLAAVGICPNGFQQCGVQETIKLNQCQGVWVEGIGEAGRWP